MSQISTKMSQISIFFIDKLQYNHILSSHYHRANVDRLSKNSDWKLTLTSRDLVRTLDQVIHEFGHFELSRTLLRIMFFSLSVSIWNVRLKEMWVDTIDNLNEELFSTECCTLNKYSLLRIFFGL